MAKRKISLQEAFWKYTDRRGPDECWPWMGYRLRDKYGRVSRRNNGKTVSYLTHRISWEIHNGPIPEGLHPLHECDNPPCGNPRHLFLGTQLDNVRDMIAKGRRSPLACAFGENSPRAKLTADDVRAIRASIEKQTVLAIRHGVAQHTISRIRARVRWKHLT